MQIGGQCIANDIYSQSFSFNTVSNILILSLFHSNDTFMQH